MTEEERLLRHYGEIMPMWAYKAYCCNPMIHKTVLECAQRNVKPADLPWELLAAALAQSVGMEDLLPRQTFMSSMPSRAVIPHGATPQDPDER